MKGIAAKNNKIIQPKPFIFEIPASLQENLTTAIHGAFEVAVEIAVLEVTKLISAAAGDMYEKIRHENETLKEELQKAQSIIESVCSQAEGISSQDSQPLRDSAVPSTAAAHNGFMSDKDTKGTRSGDQPPPDAHHKDEETGQYFASQDDDASGPREQKNNWPHDTVEDKPSKSHASNTSDSSGNNTEISHDYGVKVERTNQPCMGEEAPAPPAVSFVNNDAPQLVKVKVEKPEELLIGSDSLVDPFKEDAISQLQSEIMQDWTPGMSHFENEQQDVTLQAHNQVHGRPPNVNFSLDMALDSASTLDVNFPGNVTDLTQDPSPLQTYGSPARRSQVGGKRTKLQLYPPGCSPFRCSECNREFNRLENLKTHLRIHTGERPYKCSVCSTAFRHSGALTRHFRIHTGEKPYVCGLCGKSFRNCGGLKFHQHSHNKQMQN